MADTHGQPPPMTTPEALHVAPMGLPGEALEATIRELIAAKAARR